eukprot:CAMPEP_0113991894 /NCGR_PEP_ID=MMETSP0328-20130328/9319_1 /TAXON_ID=39455 /ORGANISM="Alexandrium minutum" /LENGTH=35 /assembly_acc=CAM_ASM_000350
MYPSSKPATSSNTPVRVQHAHASPNTPAASTTSMT